jgi:Recombinase
VGCHAMKKFERVRQVVSGPLQPEDLQKQTQSGWKLVAVEWEREIETSEEQLPASIPFGLRIAPDTLRLEESPGEREILLQMLELLVQEGSYTRIADEINRRGFRTREGTLWTAVSVFEMLPRLVEVGPHMFRSTDWQARRPQVTAR